MVAVKPA